MYKRRTLSNQWNRTINRVEASRCCRPEPPWKHHRDKWSAMSWQRHQMEIFPRYWALVRGIHRSPVNSPHKGQWRAALMLSLICFWINGWVNHGEAGALRRHRAHYDVIVMDVPVWYVFWIPMCHPCWPDDVIQNGRLDLVESIDDILPCTFQPNVMTHLLAFAWVGMAEYLWNEAWPAPQ